MRDEPDPVLAAHGAALIAHAVASTSAPLTLRSSLARAGLAERPARHFRISLARGLAGAAAAVVACAALVLPGGSPGGPSISEAAELGVRPATAPVHASAADPAQVAVDVEGTAFPTWKRSGWTPTGVRSDTLDGRPVKTVFYTAPDGTRVSYSIVGGRWLPGTPRLPHAVRTEHRGGRWVVVWARDGRTCILTAPDGFAVKRLQTRAAKS